jgi:hypothetical protein
MVCPELNSHVDYVKRWGQGVQGGASIGECPMFTEIDDGPNQYAPSQKRKKVVTTPMN